MNYTFKACRVRNFSLIHRGSNGGEAGEDFHIQFTYPDRRSNIRGTCNHKINFIPIMTSEGVTKTIGEFIVIKH